MVMELLGNDGLSDFIDVYVPHRLPARMVQVFQCSQRSAAMLCAFVARRA